jgi:hypothetical protein
MDKFNYLDSEINSEWKIEGQFNKRGKAVLNSIKGILWNRDILKQCRTTIYEVYFKPTLIFNAEIWIFTQGSKRKYKRCI